MFSLALPFTQFKTSNNFRTRQRRNASYFCLELHRIFAFHSIETIFFSTFLHILVVERIPLLTTFSSYQREALTSHHSRVGSLLHPHLVTGRWERKKTTKRAENKSIVFFSCVLPFWPLFVPHVTLFMTKRCIYRAR